MSDTLTRVRALVRSGAVRISAHGYDELADDGIYATDALAGLDKGQLVEDYPDAAHGPSVLVLQADGDGRRTHVVWGSRAAGRNLLHSSQLIGPMRVDGPTTS